MATPLGVPLLRSSNFDCSQVCVPSACKTLVASRKTENVSQSLRGNSKVVPRLYPRLCLKKLGYHGERAAQELPRRTDLLFHSECTSQGRAALPNSNRQYLRAGNHIIERLARGLIHRRLAQYHHILRPPHAIHYIHDGEGECRHNLVSDHRFRVAFEQGYVDAVVDVLLIKPSNGRGEVELSTQQRRTMADAVQGVTIADQNAQRHFGRRRRDVNRNLVDQSIPPIWTEHGFNRNVVTGTGFGYVSPGTFQTRRAAVADKVKIKLHTANIRHAVWIIVDTAAE